MVGSRVPTTSGVEVFATTVDGSYSLTVVVGVSVWGVVGVVIPWGGRLVLPFCVCVCVPTTADLIYVIVILIVAF